MKKESELKGEETFCGRKESRFLRLCRGKKGGFSLTVANAYRGIYRKKAYDARKNKNRDSEKKSSPGVSVQIRTRG